MLNNSDNVTRTEQTFWKVSSDDNYFIDPITTQTQAGLDFFSGFWRPWPSKDLILTVTNTQQTTLYPDKEDQLSEHLNRVYCRESLLECFTWVPLSSVIKLYMWSNIYSIFDNAFSDKPTDNYRRLSTCPQLVFNTSSVLDVWTDKC